MSSAKLPGQRKLSTFPIATGIYAKLSENGFETADDVIRIGPIDLAKETGLSELEALDVLDTVQPRKKGNTSGKNALDILAQEHEQIPIPTFCHGLDSILGGGVPPLKLTELCGTPGTGKTQMCMQLCANVQIPKSCGGCEGEAIFIDTEGSFYASRLAQIVSGTIESCQKIVKASNQSASIDHLTLEKLMDGVHYFLCKDFAELIACINVMEEFLTKHPKVSLIIIDSISFHFRYGFDKKFALRTKLLFGLSQSLVKLSTKFKLAVIVTNQMTTRTDNEGNLVTLPALGESWGHACTIRVILSLEDSKRQALLFKSPWKAEATAHYKITSEGIRDDVVTDEGLSTTENKELPKKKLKTS